MKIKKFAAVLLAAVCCMGAAPSENTENNSASAVAEICSTASAMAVMDGDDGELLYSKNCDDRCEPASTTKICTAITVIENFTMLDVPVPIPDEAVGVEGSSLYLQKGECMTARDLLYGLMLQSGNDCAVALAIIAGGSVDGFVKMMNDTARAAGAKNTNFKNPHGLHDDEHYTTARDLCAISYYAMKNELFREIVSTKRHRTPYYGHNYDRNFPNKNKMLFDYEGGNGIKTGFTKKSGRCLVSSATRDGKTYICTVLNCGNMWEESKRLLDAAFSSNG